MPHSHGNGTPARAEAGSLHPKVKTALDETRLLILGAQILLGFHLNAAFQPGFAKLADLSRALFVATFCAMAVAVGLLITPRWSTALLNVAIQAGAF